jgi:glycosyltransferase involved in cell wall biosynthesis
LTYSLVQALEGRASVMPCLHDEPQLKWTTTAELLGKSRHVFFLTEEEKTLAIREFGRAVGRCMVESPVVGVGVELPSHIEKALEGPTVSERIHARLQLPDNFFVYMGRKDVGKNILTLLRYFKDYRLNGGRAALLFVGGGDASLVPAEEGVFDFGVLSEEEKYFILSRALGLINLSENESFSLVIMEAWLCGVPVVVSESCEVTTAHCRRSNGGIPVSCSEEFQVALEMLENRATRAALASAGKRYICSNYSWDQVVNRLLWGVSRT